MLLLPELAVAQAPVAAVVAARAAREQAVDVLVVLDDSEQQRQLDGAVGTAATRRHLDRSGYRGVLRARSQLLGALKDDVLLGVADPDLEIRTDFDQLPVVHLRLHSARALQRLRMHPRVKLVDAVQAVRPTLAQSLPLISQPQAQAAGHAGTGTTVAVLDTGVDYSRAAFGACGSPGGSCKVAYAQDFAAQDNQLDANGHGSNVAGIVLGVAPGARIAALDVFESDGLAYSNVIIAAINWAISNRATYDIAAINMSLGGGRYTAPITPGDAWSTAISNAVAAGIVVVAAAGNDGYTNALASPAAYANVVSVGAFYDSAMGPMGWSGCSDSSTAAYKVTCFSNSASFLTMTAPGALINAAGLVQGGTSQAAPHVAGAVAVLHADYPSASAAEIIAMLKLGENLTDGRNGIAKPRLDLLAALGVPPATYRLLVSRGGSGSVSSDVGGIECGSTCSADINNGDSVVLTALHGPDAMFGGWSGACTGAGITCTVTMSAVRSVSATFNARSSEEFLPSGLLPPTWTQPSGSGAAWAPTSGEHYAGGWSLHAGAIGHGQTSSVRFSGHFAAGNISFARRVSSEAGQDMLSFAIDGVTQGGWSGELAWTMVAFPVSAGNHTLTWTYAKSASGVGGADTAWIDAVNLPLAAADRRQSATDFNGDGRADILYVHAANGTVSLWLMDGALRMSGSAIVGRVADLGWRAVAAGDFDGDGKADILWRHAVSGANSLWFMDGMSRQSGWGGAIDSAGTVWRVASPTAPPQR